MLWLCGFILKRAADLLVLVIFCLDIIYPIVPLNTKIILKFNVHDAVKPSYSITLLLKFSINMHIFKNIDLGK